jgi:2-keto-3-deoxy-6-phosphogluconate aldolase
MAPELAMTEEIAARLSEKGIIAVLEIERKEDAEPVAKALLEGGVTAIELALHSPGDDDRIRHRRTFGPIPLVVWYCNFILPRLR